MLNRRKVAKHFTIAVTGDSFSYARNQESITAEAKLDGIYVLRTSVEPGDLDSSEVVSSCKAVRRGQRAFRAFNTTCATSARSGTAPRTGSRGCVPADDLNHHRTCKPGSRPSVFTDDDKPASNTSDQ